MRGWFGCFSHVPLQDCRRQHSTGSKHSVTIDVEPSGTVALDHEPTARLLLHDGHCGTLVHLIITGPQPMSTTQKWAGMKDRETQLELIRCYVQTSDNFLLLIVIILIIITKSSVGKL